MTAAAIRRELDKLKTATIDRPPPVLVLWEGQDAAAAFDRHCARYPADRGLDPAVIRCGWAQ